MKNTYMDMRQSRRSYQVLASDIVRDLRNSLPPALLKNICDATLLVDVYQTENKPPKITDIRRAAIYMHYMDRFPSADISEVSFAEIVSPPDMDSLSEPLSEPMLDPHNLAETFNAFTRSVQDQGGIVEGTPEHSDMYRVSNVFMGLNPSQPEPQLAHITQRWFAVLVSRLAFHPAFVAFSEDHGLTPDAMIRELTKLGLFLQVKNPFGRRSLSYLTTWRVILMSDEAPV